MQNRNDYEQDRERRNRWGDRDRESTSGARSYDWREDRGRGEKEYERDFGRGDYSNYGRGESGSEGGWGSAGYSGGRSASEYSSRGRSSTMNSRPQGEYGSRGYGSDSGQWAGDYNQEGRRYGQDEGYRSSGGYGASYGSYAGGMGTSLGAGRFTGKGPKNYQRSDDRIREDVNEQLTRHPDLDATEIDVQVSNSEVTLSGSVDERRGKRLAEDIAEGVSGVKNVHNNIRVHTSTPSTQPAAPAGSSGRAR